MFASPLEKGRGGDGGRGGEAKLPAWGCILLATLANRGRQSSTIGLAHAER
jgi:hypothetical protein